MLAINYPAASIDTPDITEHVFPINYEREFIFPASEGDFISSGNNEDADIFQAVTDGDPIVRTFRNFTVQAGHTVRPNVRCKGLYLNILGDCTLAGVLSMTARGAVGQGKFVGIFPDFDRIFYCAAQADYNVVSASVSRLIIGAIGGAGGSRPTNDTHQAAGKAGTNNAGGGGGSGAAGGNINAACNNGTAGTSFSGGSGGGGIVDDVSWAAITAHAAAYGGQGGNSYQKHGSYTTSTGVGNPAGTRRVYAGTSYVSPSGTGGAIVLIVHGKLTITADTSAGLWANGVASTNASNYGGGSGGGLIHVFCYGEIENKGTISVAGGARGGGAGSKTMWQKVNGIWNKVAV